jgi:hypothetical protein
VDIYLRTRGLDKDYRFLGEAPAEFWWRNYRAWTDTEGPTILLESDASSWRAYIAGISSARRDLSDRPIQFNLAFAGPHEPAGAEGRDFVLAVLGRSVTDLAEQDGGSISGEALDEVLPQDAVERMLASPGEETWPEVAAAVRAAYGTWAPVDEAETPPAWTGGIANAGARELFLSFAAGLLGGNPGRALVLNLLSTAEDAAQIVEAGALPAVGAGLAGLAVLAARSGSPLDGEVTELAAKKGEKLRFHQPYQDPGRTGPTVPPRPRRPARRAAPARVAAMVGLAALTLGALTLGALMLGALTLGVVRIEQTHSTPRTPDRPSSQPTTVTQSVSLNRSPSPGPSVSRPPGRKPSRQPTP